MPCLSALQKKKIPGSVPFIQIVTSVLIGSILGQDAILHQSFVEIR